MINPIMADPIANISTPLAEISFAIFAFSFLYGITISTTLSIAVLNSSPPITVEKQIIHIIHSYLLIFNKIPTIFFLF